jgi:hypothetical protein
VGVVGSSPWFHAYPFASQTRTLSAKLSAFVAKMIPQFSSLGTKRTGTLGSSKSRRILPLPRFLAKRVAPNPLAGRQTGG